MSEEELAAVRQVRVSHPREEREGVQRLEPMHRDAHRWFDQRYAGELKLV